MCKHCLAESGSRAEHGLIRANKIPQNVQIVTITKGELVLQPRVFFRDDRGLGH